MVPKIECSLSRTSRSTMFTMMKQVIQGYPEQYKERILSLKSLGEQELQTVINDLLTKPQRFVGFSGTLTLSEAIQQAQREDLNFLQMEAPFLTFPKATPTKWNGCRDHIDTITGTYFIFTGKNEYERTNLRLMKPYKGGPQLVPTLQKALGSDIRVTMKVDPMMTPASRILLVL